MTYWRMTGKVGRHEAIEPGERVIQASYGLSRTFVRAANRAVMPTASTRPGAGVWSDDMGSAEGLAAPLRVTGVHALTDSRLLFFKKLFAIGRPKTIVGEWPLTDVVDITYDEPDSILSVSFVDGSGAGLHVPANQWPQKLVDGFAELAGRQSGSGR